MKYVSIPHGDLGQGIDALSAEDSIPEGYSESLLNFEPTPEGYLRKREGYQQVWGYLPIRVFSVEGTSSPNELTFHLDTSVDLSAIQSAGKSRPIVVYGRTSTSTGGGDFDSSTDAAHWYPGFSANPRQTFETGTHTLSLPATDTDLMQSLVWTGLTASDQTESLSNTQFLPDSVSVDLSTFETDVTYTNSASAFDGFVYFNPIIASAGSVYTQPVIVGTGVQTFTVPAATHQLDNGNVLAKLFDQSSGSSTEVRLDSVTVATSDTVEVTLTNSTGSPFNAILTLVAPPVSQEVQGVTTGAATTSISFPASSAFNFVGCYLEQSLGGTREQVLPNSVSYDAATGLVTVELDTHGSTGQNFFVYWVTSAVTVNKLTVQAYTPKTFALDTKPQLTIWGLDHQLSYRADAAARAGWVTELDTYRSTDEQFLVSGLGGVLHQGQAADAATRASYLIPQFYPALRSRVQTSAVCGPTFLNSASPTFRTRGHIQADNVGDGFAFAAAFTFDSGTGWTRIDFPLVNGVQTDANAVVPGDYLEIQSAGYAVHEGSWPIKQVTFSSTQLSLWVDNPGVTTSDWDDSGAAAQGFLLTDRFTCVDSPAPFIPGDVLLAATLTENEQVTCVSASASEVVWDGFPDRLDLPSGLRIAAQRTGSVMPLRDINDQPTVTNLVGGDNLQVTGYAREFRVKALNPDQTRALTLTGDGTSATAVLGTGTTDYLAVGDTVLLVQAGAYTGEREITSIVDSTSFTFASTSTDAEAGYLWGRTAWLDESVLWQDDVDSAVTASVPGRWLPVEAPATQYAGQAGLDSTHVQYLSGAYDDQALLRSSMVSSSLMMTNGQDRPMKLDGSSVYRPGLIRWQPQLFVTLATGATGKIDLTASRSTCSLTGAFWTGNRFQVAAADLETFAVGARIQRHGNLQEIYTVVAAETTSTPDYWIIVDRNITGAAAADTLQSLVSFSYYFRLNAVDANQNIVASAATGSFDCTVNMSQDAAVRLRLIGLPALDIWDYDRIEVQIYRTKANGVAPYYLLTTIPLSFADWDGYIDYEDTAADNVLFDLDPVNTGLKGQELGTGWSPPVRAERLTSIGNRLVLGNITSDPYIDLRFLNSSGTGIPTSSFTGKRFLLLKDEADTATTADNVNRFGYEFVSTGSELTVNALTTVPGVSFTVSCINPTGLAPGDWVYLFRFTAPNANQRTWFMGWWQVESCPSAFSFTVKWADAPSFPTLAQQVDRFVKATAGTDVPVWLSGDYNFQWTRQVTPPTSSAESYAMMRWAAAVNATQRQVSPTQSPGFRPWVVADAGSEFAQGQLVFRQPQDEPTAMALVLPSAFAQSIYGNDVLRDPGSTVGALQRKLGSRVLVSYQNFAEIFDSPFAQVDSESDSAIDCNPADGQDITAVIPFFGDSTFGAAMKDSILLVFKSQSVYVVNLAAKAAGQNPLQRLETMGLGCTAPNSVTPTRTGIMFCNQSGIYKLNPDMTLYYMGRHLQRLWREQANLNALDLVFGHNYAFSSQYKISYPQRDSEVPDRVFAYNSTREYSTQGVAATIQQYSTREGSWTQHEPLDAPIGWANLFSDSYAATRRGRVMQQRRTGLPQDFRDDDQAIAASATLRALDFGDEGIRKSSPWVILTYRNPDALGDRSGTTLESSVDLSNDWTPTDLALLPDNAARSGVGDQEGQRGVGYRYALQNKRGVRLQLRITNSVKDQPVEITRIRYQVAGLTQAGVREAASGPARGNRA